MSQQALLFASYDNPLVLCDSADFDGTNDYMTRGAGLTGAADSKTGILSLWIRLDGGDGATMAILRSTVAANQFLFLHNSSNIFSLGGDNSAGTEILLLQSNTAYTAGATWLHFLASWDLANAAGHLYINGTSDLAAGSTLTDDTLDYTLADWGIGAQVDGNLKLNGCLAEFYFAPGQYLDFSNAYNRRKFISATGKPVSLGATGSLPTGTAPLVYQRVADAAAVATFATNLGSGGDFSITGTLATGSTSPSD